MNLTQHFTLEEFIFSDTATRLGIANIPSPGLFPTFRATCGGLERIRTIADNPIVIISGWRSELLNKVLGGAHNSQHLDGEAADILCPGLGDALKLAQLIEEHALAIKFDQLILEFSQWVHVSFSITPRYQVLTMRSRLEGYIPGIVV